MPGLEGKSAPSQAAALTARLSQVGGVRKARKQRPRAVHMPTRRIAPVYELPRPIEITQPVVGAQDHAQLDALAIVHGIRDVLHIIRPAGEPIQSGDRLVVAQRRERHLHLLAVRSGPAGNVEHLPGIAATLRIFECGWLVERAARPVAGFAALFRIRVVPDNAAQDEHGICQIVSFFLPILASSSPVVGRVCSSIVSCARMMPSSESTRSLNSRNSLRVRYSVLSSRICCLSSFSRVLSSSRNASKSLSIAIN